MPTFLAGSLDSFFRLSVNPPSGCIFFVAVALADSARRAARAAASSASSLAFSHWACRDRVYDDDDDWILKHVKTSHHTV
jgi:hypothetical protein